MAKNILKIDYTFENKVIGLASQAADYKIAWVLNKILKINLAKEPDHTIALKNNETLMVSNFIYQTENSTLRLLRNKSVENASQYLLPEFKNLDYIFLIEDETDHWDTGLIKNQLQAHNAIQFVQPIEPDNIKSKENLMF